MSPTLSEKRIASLYEYTKKVSDLNRKHRTPVWFRGVEDASHKLVPSLYRPKSKTQDLLQKEQDILNMFTHRAVPYLAYPLQSDWDRLFMMQHFGVPTRLLDWTENPFIALFFALRNKSLKSKKDAAIWLLMPAKWNASALARISAEEAILSTSDEHLAHYQPSKIQEAGELMPVAIYGIHNSPRIVAQRGTFTIFGNKKDPMETIYASGNFPASCLQKITIPTNMTQEILNSLYATGITDSVVFPDLDGLARDIKRMFDFE